MNRRQYLSVLGTVAVSAVGLWTAYQLDQGNITLGEDSDVSATVRGTPESLEFDVPAGTDVRVSVRDTGTEDAPYTGSFTLQDPNGDDVLDGGPRSSQSATRTHTAERGGTYRLTVNPQGTRLLVNVFLTDGDE